MPQKIWKWTLWVWEPCNPLKSHKTAKTLFGNVWRETCEIWKSLQKSLEAALILPLSHNVGAVAQVCPDHARITVTLYLTPFYQKTL